MPSGSTNNFLVSASAAKTEFSILLVSQTAISGGKDVACAVISILPSFFGLILNLNIFDLLPQTHIFVVDAEMMSKSSEGFKLIRI